MWGGKGWGNVMGTGGMRECEGSGGECEGNGRDGGMRREWEG